MFVLFFLDERAAADISSFFVNFMKGKDLNPWSRCDPTGAPDCLLSCSPSSPDAESKPQSPAPEVESGSIPDSKLPLYAGSDISVHDALVSILSYAHSAHLSGKDTAELLKLLEILLPKPNNLPKSHHLFKTYFKDNSELKLLFYCSNCWRSRNSFNDLCTECPSTQKKVSYFISCPLEAQLQKLYSRPGFCDMLKYKSSRIKNNVNNIEDIYAGTVYKEAEKNILSDPNNISFTWYSDGVAPFESSLYSLWPCMFIINELPPEERHKPENLLMGGL